MFVVFLLLPSQSLRNSSSVFKHFIGLSLMIVGEMHVICDDCVTTLHF